MKQVLNNGYVLTFATYISSWQYKTIGNDPSTTADDAFAGKPVAHWMNGTSGGHMMTVVGYSDDLWTDVNGNGAIDPGEKGAFRIANSWGTGWRDGGFIWVAYDAFRTTSAVAGGPSTGRLAIASFYNNNMYSVQPLLNYEPKLLAKFRLNHAKRNQVYISLGIGETTASIPAATWPGVAINGTGGAYAFDGTLTPVDGTFVFDFSDLVPTGSSTKRYFLSARDTLTGDVLQVLDFRLVDIANGNVEISASDVPFGLDAKTDYARIDYNFYDGNVGPIAAATVSPLSSLISVPVSFDASASTDPDGTIVQHSWSFGDGNSALGAVVSHAYKAAGSFTATLKVTDNKGATATKTFVIVVTDPDMLVAPSGLTATVASKTVTLKWTDNSTNESGFYVERAPKSGSFVRIGTLGANATGFSETVVNGQYRYRVQGFNSFTGKVSTYTAIVTVNIKGK